MVRAGGGGVRGRGDRSLDRHGIDPGRPTVAYVGRITRQKGLPVLLRAAQLLDPDVQLVLCAGQADTEELGAEVTRLVGHLRSEEHTSELQSQSNLVCR